MIQDYLNSVENFIVVGARVLLKPRDLDTLTRSGLVLPAGIRDKEEIQSGYVLKTGPGIAIPSLDADEPWKQHQTKYLSLQAKEGDLAIYLKSKSHEIEFENEKYIIIPHDYILLLIRDEALNSL